MAKGLRSSTKKANRTKLRSGVFGPVEDARKERLSTKLLELAANPQTVMEEDAKMIQAHQAVERRGSADPGLESEVVAEAQDGLPMDIDQPNGSPKNHKFKSAARIQKKGRTKASGAMVFPVYKKGKRIGQHQKRRK